MLRASAATGLIDGMDTLTGGPTDDGVQMTWVGSTWVLFDPSTGRVWKQGSSTPFASGSDASGRLQQSSEASTTVADRRRLRHHPTLALGRQRYQGVRLRRRNSWRTGRASPAPEFGHLGGRLAPCGHRARNDVAVERRHRASRLRRPDAWRSAHPSTAIQRQSHDSQREPIRMGLGRALGTAWLPHRNSGIPIRTRQPPNRTTGRRH